MKLRRTGKLRSKTQYTLGMIVLILLLYARTSRGGISTPFGKVLIENLRIGQSYSIKEEENFPLIVKNEMGFKINLKIEVNPPQLNMMKPNYEVIPDISWVRLEQRYFELEPEEQAVTDVTITIPEDKKYMGKRYEAWIWSHTMGMKINIGINSRLLFSIAETTGAFKKGNAKLRREKKQRKKGGFRFKVDPEQIYLYGVKPGKKVDVKKWTKTTFKLTNEGDENYFYTVKAAGKGQVLRKLAKGYEICPEPSFLQIKKKEFTVPAKKTKEIGLKVRIPNKGEHKGKKYAFILKISQEGATIERIIYVNVE